MNEISQELVDDICSYLDHDSLKSTLLLSRKFQSAAERYSEAFRIFSLNTGNIDDFIATYSGQRFRYLRHVGVEAVLPTTEKSQGPDEWVYGDNIYRE
jgi:hypothetical protein